MPFTRFPERLSLLFLILFVQAAPAELVVYTARKEHLVKDVFEQYTKETGTKIRYKTGKSPALIQTLKAEGENSPADIFMTVDAGNLWFAAKEGLFEAVNSKTLNNNIPSHLRDVNSRWFGLSVRTRTIVYNKNEISKKQLVSYQDLALPKWKGKLCLRTSKSVYNQSLVAMLIGELGKKKTQEILQGWVNNSVDIFSNDTAVLKAVVAGQCSVGIVNSYYFGRLIKKEPTLPLKLFWPNQSSFGVHVNVSGAGVLKSSQQKPKAIKFLEWLSSMEAQKSFAQVNMEFPVLSDAPQSDIVKEWGSFKPNSRFSLTHAGSLQREAIQLMQQVGYK